MSKPRFNSNVYYLQNTAECRSCQCTSCLPGRMGLPWSNSAKMQPTDHMSTAGLYLVDPSSSSGGLWSSITSDQTSFCKWGNFEGKTQRFFWACVWHNSTNPKIRPYLYHKVMTRFVSGCSLLKDLASPKSASFRFPLLSIRRLEPTMKTGMGSTEHVDACHWEVSKCLQSCAMHYRIWVSPQNKFMQELCGWANSSHMDALHLNNPNVQKYGLCKLGVPLRIMCIMVKEVCYWLKKPTTATFTLLTVQQSFDYLWCKNSKSCTPFMSRCSTWLTWQ